MTGQVQIHVGTRTQRFPVAFLFFLSVASLLAHGQPTGASATSVPDVNQVPRIDALSPISSMQGGRSFTLSVVGYNFTSASTIQWNGNTLLTTLVSGKARISVHDVSD